jgi:hypothetical protein
MLGTSGVLGEDVRMYESYVLDRYWLKKVVTARGERLIFDVLGRSAQPLSWCRRMLGS